MNATAIIKTTVRYILSIILAIFILLSLQYLHTEIYHLNRPTPFRGQNIYNPYEDWTGEKLKANFHMHSNVWNSLTSGLQNKKEIFQHYRNHNYDIASMSDYHRITTPDSHSPNYIPAYEHGLNIKKSHQIILNPSHVRFFDFPLLQTRHHKQQVINKLHKYGGLIVLAHPELGNGYLSKDVETLAGYDFIEVVNHQKRSEQVWDAALTSGNPVWLLANDDTHDINKTSTCANWNIIGTANKNKENVLNTLKKGCHYGIKNKKHQKANDLDSLIVNDGIIEIYLRDTAHKISFISDFGVTRKVVLNKNQASYQIQEDDTYVRIEVENLDATLYFNPVIRYENKIPTAFSAIPNVNIIATILWRLGVIAGSTILLFLLLLLNKKILVEKNGSVLPRLRFSKDLSSTI